jgi:hypothetical protein
MTVRSRLAVVAFLLGCATAPVPAFAASCAGAADCPYLAVRQIGTPGDAPTPGKVQSAARDYVNDTLFIGGGQNAFELGAQTGLVKAERALSFGGGFINDVAVSTDGARYGVASGSTVIWNSDSCPTGLCTTFGVDGSRALDFVTSSAASPVIARGTSTSIVIGGVSASAGGPVQQVGLEGQHVFASIGAVINHWIYNGSSLTPQTGLTTAGEVAALDTSSTEVLAIIRTGGATSTAIRYDFNLAQLGSFAVPATATGFEPYPGGGWWVSTAESRALHYDAAGTLLETIEDVAPGRMAAPDGLAVDALDGGLWVADTGSKRGIKFDASGAPETVLGPEIVPLAGAGAAGTAPFRAGSPTEFASRPGGGLVASGDFVTGANQPGVGTFDQAGVQQTTWPSTSTEGGVSASATAIYTVKGNRVVQRDAGGTIVRTLGRTDGTPGSGAGWFDSPQDTAVGPDGTLWVADTNNHRIQAFTPGGVWLRTIGSAGSAPGFLDKPESVAIDVQGNVVVADTGNQRIQRFTPEGELLAVFGDADGFSNMTFHSVAVGLNGTVFAARTGVGIVEAFDFGPAPTAVTAAADAVGATGAMVHGSVTAPRANTQWWFEWGDDQLAQRTAQTTGDGPVSAQLTNLSPGHVYRYRLVVQDVGGQRTHGNELTFTTSSVSGPAGSPGQDGTDGTDGTQGLPGADGAVGPVGLSGPQGLIGPRGPAGRDALVTCKVSKPKRRKTQKVTCTVKSVSAARKLARVRISRGGKVMAYGHGRFSRGGHLRLHIRRNLPSASYRLTVIVGRTVTHRTVVLSFR